MAVVDEYSDFAFLLFSAFAMQFVALMSAVKNRRKLGNSLTFMFIESNIYMLVFDTVLISLMLIAYLTPEVQPIEIGVLYLAFAFPNLMGFNNLRKQRYFLWGNMSNAERNSRRKLFGKWWI